MSAENNTITPKLSIVLNAHREADAMHPTLRSVVRAIKYYDEQTTDSAELCIVLDKTDDKTRSYFDSVKNTILAGVRYSIIEVENGDLGMSRNDGIAVTKGVFLAVIDADDVYTKQYFINAVRALEMADDKTIVHPSYVISFGEDRDELWRPISSDDPAFLEAGIVEYNPWPSQAIARREVFETFPYSTTKADSGLGPEDWHFNCETLFHGYRHLAAEDVAYFYRRKANSSLAAAHARSLLPRTSMLGKDGYKIIQSSLSAAKQSAQPHTEKQPVDYALLAASKVLQKTKGITMRIARVSKRTEYFAERMHLELRHLFRPRIKTTSRQIFPEWLVDEWRELHLFDHQIYPTHRRVHEMSLYQPQLTQSGRVYWDFMRQVGEAEYVFFTPWLRTGGADLVVLNYVKAVKSLDRDARIAVVATELSESPWSSLLPDDVVFIEMPEWYHKGLAADVRARLLAAAMYQSNVRTIHIINSADAFLMLTDYSRQLGAKASIFISAFSIDITPDGSRAHYLYDHLSHSIDDISRVVTDNASVIEDLVTRFHFPRQKFKVHYQPSTPGVVEASEILGCHILDETNLKVMWAARLDIAKRADVLVEIAKRAHVEQLPVEFHVYGSAVLDQTNILQELKQLPNVRYEGPFTRGIKQLPCDRFDLFLMTSQWEGLPNALLESTHADLPVMSSVVGGIGEFITEETGFPIKRFDNIDEYIDTFKEILSDRSLLDKKKRAAHALVKNRHSIEAFTRQVAEEPGYMRGEL